AKLRLLPSCARDTPCPPRSAVVCALCHGRTLPQILRMTRTSAAGHERVVTARTGSRSLDVSAGEVTADAGFRPGPLGRGGVGTPPLGPQLAPTHAQAGARRWPPA